MPPRHRLNTQAAAALPPSRLPVGTPHVNSVHSPPASSAGSSDKENTADSPSAAVTTRHTDDLHTKHPAKVQAEVGTSRAMVNTDIPAMSLAEAKLARQNDRIKQAEAALTAPLPLDRDRQTSRGKGKAWKTLDLTTLASHSSTPDEGGVAVPPTEVRINTFRTSTRDSSVSRSMSSLSQRTTNTLASDAERQDSAVFEASGFQLYRGRKLKDKSVYRDKSEERQTTVEATFDEREIYHVFGNALPAPDFIDQTVGGKNGELKFVQHPNGDVSAHQWSDTRYVWENIGQFSNIRKKIEGQLASDRLKGETTYQTLQQNTLAYFRIIAKQREAGVMGVPFGVKDIQAALPDLQPRPANVVVATKPAGEFPAKVSLAAGFQKQINTSEPSAIGTSINHNAVPFLHEDRGGYVGHEGYGGLYDDQNQYTMSYVPTAPRAMHSTSAITSQMYDPFYPSPSYQDIYGSHGVMQAGVRTSSTGYGQYTGLDTFSQIRFDRRIPSNSVTARSRQGVGTVADDEAWPRLQSRQIRTDPSRPRLDATQNEVDLAAASALTRSQMLARQQQDRRTSLDTQLPTSVQRRMAGHFSEPGNIPSIISANGTPTAVPRINSTSPQSTRNPMRDHLIRLGDQAKERSRSRTELRSLMYDPFQSSSSPASAKAGEQGEDGDVQRVWKTVANPSGVVPTPKQNRQSAIPARPFTPTVGARRSTQPNFHEESDVRPSENEGISSTRRHVYTEDGPIHQDEEYKHADRMLTATQSSIVQPSKQFTDQDLKEWWTSGNTFQRQDEFYRSLKSTSANSASYDTSTPSAANTITPAKAPLPPLSTDDPMTRLLIPVLENLASYVQGPVEKRRDYFSRWSQPPEWCIDHGPNGNNSFFDDSEWGQPPARVGRDARYRPLPGVESVRFGGFSSPQGSRTSSGSLAVGGAVTGLDRRFTFGPVGTKKM